jgi:hypothetical protein
VAKQRQIFGQKPEITSNTFRGKTYNSVSCSQNSRVTTVFYGIGKKQQLAKAE